MKYITSELNQKKFYSSLLFIIFIFSLFFLARKAMAQNSTGLWDENLVISEPRENIFKLDPLSFQQAVIRGRRHTLIYPVTTTELKIPFNPLKNFLESSPDDPVRKVLWDLGKKVSPYETLENVFQWLGLNPQPRFRQPENPNPIPQLSAEERHYPLGVTLIENHQGTGLTFGCATCHSSSLFGVTVLGLTNRFPRANQFFDEGAKLAPYVNTFLFQNLLKTTEGERLILLKSKKALRYVGTKRPQTLGLDTSLAQVALSLAKREQDPFATKSKSSYLFPRKNKLETMISDSKPAVWWNLKYKNRWLSDGSVVSGNPIFTNILWNELGRGADLKKLEKWLYHNQKTIQELTAAVFAMKAPRYIDFFGEKSIDISKAKKGEILFNKTCSKCHGTYVKGWSDDHSSSLLLTSSSPTRRQLLETLKVQYPKQTKVIDVGTDPGRYLGMKEFADDLNRLQISKKMKAKVIPQKGYVPPPLVGIWARWPYFHNNSVPDLCSLLTPGELRPSTYWAGPAKDKNRDFDQVCNGYPRDNETPEEWKKNPEFLYDTSKEGLSNKGHDRKIFIKDGKELFSSEDKLNLIEFLKTL